MLKEHNLFTAQWSVLICIHKHEEMTLTEIWKYLNVEAPTITRTVKISGTSARNYSVNTTQFNNNTK